MEEEDIKFCREMLEEVSRSFALTIPMLDDELQDPVTIIYLQDRLLDSFEDELPDIDLDTRTEMMDSVVELFDPGRSDPAGLIDRIQGWAFRFQDESLGRLVRNCDRLWRAYRSLPADLRGISYPWLEEMNRGMQIYLQESVASFEDLDDYCYYVAGTVGGFLTDIVLYFAGKESGGRNVLEENYSEAGIFLQKVNISRDIRADITGRNRVFWPLEELCLTEEELLSSRHRSQALSALDKMIKSARSHIPALLEYLEAIPDDLPGYRKFYSVNNAMGLATLEHLHKNSDVFTSDEPVKVPRWKTYMIKKFPEKFMRRLVREHL